MNKSAHEEYLSQPIQTNSKQLELAVTFLTGYNGKLNLKKSNNKLNFIKSFQDVDFTRATIPLRAYEMVSLDNEIKRLTNEEEQFTEENY